MLVLFTVNVLLRKRLTIGAACMCRLPLVGDSAYRKSVVSVLESTPCSTAQYDHQTFEIQSSRSRKSAIDGTSKAGGLKGHWHRTLSIYYSKYERVTHVELTEHLVHALVRRRLVCMPFTEHPASVLQVPQLTADSSRSTVQSAESLCLHSELGI